MSSPLNKDTKKQIKNELENLLSQFGSTGGNPEDDIVDGQFQQIVQAPPIDFEEMNAEFLKKSRGVTDSIFDFYVSLGVLDSHNYLKIKKEMDDGNMQTIFFQVKTLKFSIEKLMQQINDGTAGPRIFEVLGQLQDKLSNAIKTQANYVLFLEESYRKVKSDLQNREDAPALTDGSDKKTGPKNKGEYFISAGTKNVMRDLAGEPQDPSFVIEDVNKNLTDPRQKNDLMESKGLGHLIVVENDEDDYSDAVAEII